MAFGAYLQEARRFYQTVSGDPDLQGALAERGVGEAAVTAAQADLDQLERLEAPIYPQWPVPGKD